MSVLGRGINRIQYVMNLVNNAVKQLKYMSAFGRGIIRI